MKWIPVMKIWTDFYIFLCFLVWTKELLKLSYKDVINDNTKWLKLLLNTNWDYILIVIEISSHNMCSAIVSTCILYFTKWYCITIVMSLWIFHLSIGLDVLHSKRVPMWLLSGLWRRKWRSCYVCRMYKYSWMFGKGRRW